MITFNNNKSHELITYSSEPVINIIRADYVTQDKNWSKKLISANLTIKLSVVDTDSLEVMSVINHLSLASFIDIYQKQPALEINKTFDISLDPFLINSTEIEKYTVEISLNNLSFAPDEELKISFMDSLYVKRRAEDWQHRVHNLIELLKEWTKDSESIEIRESRKQKMHEGMMKDFRVPMIEIESADILKNGKTLVVLKSFGLWIMGANGRVDLLTPKGNLVLVDEAEKFHPPIWKLFLHNNKDQGVIFSKRVFNQLLEL